MKKIDSTIRHNTLYLFSMLVGIVLISFMIHTHFVSATISASDIPNLTVSLSDNSIIMTPTVSVSGTATDSLQILSLTWAVDGGNVQIISGTIPGNLVSWSLSIPNLSNGLHTLQINATNSEGFVTSKTISLTMYNDLPITIASLPNGTYEKYQTVKLESNEPALIFYTLDGTTPSVSSPHGQDSITLPEISSNTILKFFAVDAYGVKSDVSTQVYIIDNVSSPVELSNAGKVMQSTEKIHPTNMIENRTISSVSVSLNNTVIIPASIKVVSTSITQNMTTTNTNSTLPVLTSSNSTTMIPVIAQNMTTTNTNSTLPVLTSSNSTTMIPVIAQNMTTTNTNSTLPVLTSSNSTAKIQAITQNMTTVHTNSTLPVLTSSNSTTMIPVIAQNMTTTNTNSTLPVLTSSNSTSASVNNGTK